MSAMDIITLEEYRKAVGLRKISENSRKPFSPNIVTSMFGTNALVSTIDILGVKKKVLVHNEETSMSWVQKIEDDVREGLDSGRYSAFTSTFAETAKISIHKEEEDVIALLRTLTEQSKDGKKYSLFFDLETTGLRFWRDEIVTCQFVICDDTLDILNNTIYVIGWRSSCAFWLEELSKGKSFVAHNAPFDLKFLYKNGVMLNSSKKIIDTLALARMVNPYNFYGLKYFAYSVDTVGGYDRAVDILKVKRIWEEAENCEMYGDFIRYSTTDIRVLGKLYIYLRKVIHDSIGKVDLFVKNNQKGCRYLENKSGREIVGELLDFVQQSTKVFTECEYNGWCVDKDKYDSQRKVLVDKLRFLKVGMLDSWKVFEHKSFEGKTHDDVSLKSAKDLKEIFGNVLKLPVLVRTERGTPSYSKVALKEYLKAGYGELEHLTEYFDLYYLYSMFFSEESAFWKSLEDVGDMYILHPSYNVASTQSLRLTSSNPNMQNLPKDLGVRGVFTTPSDEYVLIEIDGSGMQARSMASFTGDVELCSVFKDKENVWYGDLHSATAYNLFYKGLKSIKEVQCLKESKDRAFLEFRNIAKRANFSLIFNTTALSFAEDIVLVDYRGREDVLKSVCDAVCVGLGIVDIVGMGKYLESYYIGSSSKNLSKLVGATGFEREFCLRCLFLAVYTFKSFHSTYTGVKRYLASLESVVKDTGFLVSPFGHIRYVPALSSGFCTKGDFLELKHYQNAIMNTIAQTHEVYVICKTMINNRVREGVRWVGSIHDSVLAYVKRGTVDEFCDAVQNSIRVCGEQYNPEGIVFESGVSIYDIRGKGDVWGE